MSMDDSTKAIIEGWVSIGTAINALVVVAITTCAAVIVLRVQKKDVIKINNLDLPVKNFWMVAILYSTIHWYLAWEFYKSSLLISVLKTVDKHVAFIKLSNSANLLFGAMIPRNNCKDFIKIWNLKIQQCSIYWDPATIISILFCIILFVAVARFYGTGFKGFINGWAIGFIFFATNWLIGSWWAITFSLVTK